MEKAKDNQCKTNSIEWVRFCNEYTWKIKDEQLKNDLLVKIRKWWNQFECNIFPGPQPISIERSHFIQLKSKPYWVCAKTDGVRYIFVCTYLNNIPYCCLINRKKDTYMLKCNINKEAFQGTVLDGELVLNNRGQYEYLVYDSTIVCGADCTQKPHSERIKAALSIVDYVNQKNTQPKMHISIKTFYPLHKMEEYVQCIVPKLDHSMDGYIFTPEHEPVKSGTHVTMFKWKEQMKNTVDFLISKSEHEHHKYIMKIARGKQLITLFDNHLRVVDPKMDKQLSIEPRIVECKYVHENTWEALFIRTDKIHPNNMLTYKKTLLNISENIQLNEFYV